MGAGIYWGRQMIRRIIDWFIDYMFINHKDWDQ